MKENLGKSSIRNMECNITKEGDHYLAYIDLGKDARTGKRIRPKARGKTQEEAVKKLERTIIGMDCVDTSIDMLNWTVPDLTREYRVNCLNVRVSKGQISSRTAENYIYSIRPFEKYFEKMKVKDIDVSVLNKFFYDLVNMKNKNGSYVYSERSVKVIEFIVHNIFIWACKQGGICSDPFQDPGYEKPHSKKEMEEIEGLTPEEVREVLTQLKQYPIVYNPIMLMLNTGMRTQEVLGLQWGDIDFNKNLIHIQRAVTMEVQFDDDGNIAGRKSVVSKPKTKKSARDIGLTAEARQLLLDWREEAPEISMTRLGDNDFVFGYERKPNFTYEAFKNRVNDFLARQAGGIDKMRLHRCRHTVCTLLVAEGREIIQIMRQLGITQEKTLLRYVDKKANKKIIEGNTQAISAGLSGMMRDGQNTAGAISSEENMVQKFIKGAAGLTEAQLNMIISMMGEMARKG